MRIAVIGRAREGKSVLKFLKHHPRYRRARIVVLDQKDGPDYLAGLADFDIAFRSPGVPYNLPAIQSALRAGVKISSATKLFFDLCRAPIIGVTGTKGKGTTSTLIYKILKASGKKVLLAGNIGKSPLEIIPQITPGTTVVLELSSFQLWDLGKSPRVAIITDIFPDHMDAHRDMKEYCAAKANIAVHQKKSDAVFYFAANKQATTIAKKSPARKIAVAAPNTLEKNKVLAAAVAKYLGCPENVIARVVKNYRGMEHRLEFVRRINGVGFYNDSASTNPQTTAAAVLSLSKDSLILIAGGKDKNLDYRPLRQALKKSPARMVILMGENKDKMEKALKASGVPVKKVAELAVAVQLAYNRALAGRVPAVIFSPGAASFDMFRDYADRGKQFKKLVKKLK